MKLSSDRLEYERFFHDDYYRWKKERDKVIRWTEGIAEHAYQYFWQVIHEYLKKLPRDNAKLLDYGCGEGDIAYRLWEFGARKIYGIDISEGMIRRAKERLPQVDFRVMNAEAMDFADEFFDLVAGIAILHHLDLQKAIPELYRVLKKGGVAVFVEPMGHNPLINIFRRLTPGARTPFEHPLKVVDLEYFKEYFKVEKKHFVLSILPFLPFRPLLGKNFRRLVRESQKVDDALFRICPFLEKYSWIVVLRFLKES